ncbi:hypothetical protein [Neobacillus niacini]|uniref:hypothetical protein n=1 Tax=Neobacillus niacini TaxID=86668 RepID=UPI0039832919
MKRGLILTTLLLVMTACSAEDVSESKVDTANQLAPQTITLGETKTIKENEMIASTQVVSENVETQSSISNSYMTGTESSFLAEKPTEFLVNEKVETPAEDFIMIENEKYMNMMQDVKFQDWIDVAVKYGAALYAIPNSDVFAIVRDGEVLVGMSTGVASAAPNHIDVLCDLMADKGEDAGKIIEGIKQVTQTGESVQLVGPEEFGDDYSIEKMDEWVVVSW